jgi:hypothetical protein
MRYRARFLLASAFTLTLAAHLGCDPNPNGPSVPSATAPESAAATTPAATTPAPTKPAKTRTGRAARKQLIKGEPSGGLVLPR